MVRLVISMCIALPILWLQAAPADACGVKLSVRAHKVRRASTSQAGRTPIAVGPEAEKPREAKAVGGSDRSQERISQGETTSAQPKRPRTAVTERPSETPTEAPASETPSGEDTTDTTTATTKPTPGGDTGESRPPREARVPNFTKRVFFGNGSAALSSSSKAKLRANAKWLQQHSDKSISIEGHANTLGNADSNMALSEERAGKVKEFLVEQGIDESRISIQAFGSERPEFEPGSSGKNRRVVIVVN